MSIVAGIDLSEIIVSMANAVTDANSVLNSDPQSTMAITRFEVDTTLIASLSPPAKTHPGFQLIPEGNLHRVSGFTPQRIQGAQLAKWLQPSLLETALPTIQNQTARLQIKAVLEAIPNVSVA